MEAYANALLYAIPGFVVLILIEIAYGHFTNKQTHTVMDTISSLSSGVTNIIKDSLGLVVALISYPFLLKYLAVFDIQAAWLVYVVAFIAIDFASYWNHRLCHKVNFFWNIHVIHHSSEEFNLACALRQTISNIIGYYPVFLIPAALFGVPHEVIGVLAPIHLFAQFWYHTKHIGKLGILEYVFVTPSQHRVHHAINDVYIDKNLAAIFCVWDRWFGTFQEELDDVPPVYGVLKPASTWNPIIINFQHLWRLIKDAWKTNSYLDKLRIWFMPTGWRPKDVDEKYPIKIIENPYNFKKYEARASSLKVSWSLLQLIATTLLMYFMFYNYVNLTTNELLTYGVIVFVGVFGYTTIMDNKKYGLIFELIFCGYGTYLIFTTGDWFGMNTYITYGSYLVLFYFGFTVLGAAYFSFLERKELAIT
jgi:sterol desaturase/sphingolipid hydroxylase (fatty acid hydroxylase superfamily)